MLKKYKNNLDERQEQILLHIEQAGCWIAYVGLLLAILVQLVLFKGDFRYVAGEWAVYMVICLYVSIRCMKNGIWARSLKADAKTNAIIALIAATVIFGLVLAMVAVSYPEKMGIGVWIALAGAAFIFVICFVALSIASSATKRRLSQLEEEQAEE